MAKKKPSNKPSTSGGSSPMDVDLLEQIVKLMSANDLNTVDMRDGEKRVVLKRGAPASSGMMYAPQYAAPMPTGSPAGTAATSATASPAAPADESAGLTPIKSPMVGTFYSSSS